MSAKRYSREEVLAWSREGEPAPSVLAWDTSRLAALDPELRARREHLSVMAAKLAVCRAEAGDWAGAYVWMAHLFWIQSDEWVIAQRSGGIV